MSTEEVTVHNFSQNRPALLRNCVGHVFECFASTSNWIVDDDSSDPTAPSCIVPLAGTVRSLPLFDAMCSGGVSYPGGLRRNTGHAALLAMAPLTRHGL